MIKQCLDIGNGSCVCLLKLFFFFFCGFTAEELLEIFSERIIIL